MPETFNARKKQMKPQSSVRRHRKRVAARWREGGFVFCWMVNGANMAPSRIVMLATERARN